MNVTDWGSIIAVIATLAGTIKLLINAYFKKAKELEDFKQSSITRNIKSLENITDEHVKEIGLLKIQFKGIEDRLVRTTMDIRDGTAASDALREQLKVYTKTAEESQKGTETIIKKITDDILLLKTVVAKLGGVHGSKKAGAQ